MCLRSISFRPPLNFSSPLLNNTVRRSLADNDLTVVSIFVNPTQFAPHEDLASYPRTLPQDLEALSNVFVSSRTTSAVFLPTVQTMYPLHPGSSPESSLSRGTFVEVTSLGSVMEGASRPTFFRGVATVVTKLFNAVQPTRAYFGQKDIQQALLLRRMVSDLLVLNPTPEEVHVVPTARSPIAEHGGLALSSRNAYLTPSECEYAPTLYRALKVAEESWSSGRTKHDAIEAALELLKGQKAKASEAGVELRLDYVEMNNSDTLDVVQDQETMDSRGSNSVQILSGALWVGRTRLIDNILLGNENKILY